MSKRTDYISWDEYFMGVALLSAKRSKDPSTQVGACIINEDKRIIATGYNGFPAGISDDKFPWDKDTKNLFDSKYPYVVHAEVNAILNAVTPTKNATLYVTLFPCSDCTKMIIQSGIKEVVYLSDKHSGTDDDIAAKRMLKAAKIKVRCFNKC